MRPEPILTPRLVLRPLDPDTARAIADGDYSGVAAGRGWPTEVAALIARHSLLDPGALTWLITCDDLVIGECGLKHTPEPDGSGEIGYGLAAAWRSKGYGGEAVGGLVGRLRELSLRRLTAEVHESNQPSRRLLERIGFGQEHADPPYLWYSRALDATAAPQRAR